MQFKEKLTTEILPRLIDISAVQAFHGIKEIDELISYAKTYNFISVHTLPSWTSYLCGQLKDSPDILVGAPVGFPSGGSKTDIKIQEALQLIKDGVQEMDMVINIGKMKSGDFNYVREEIKRIREISLDIPLKVILEVHYLSEDLVKRGCEICIEEDIDFIKTGTGWAPSGATIDIIKMIKGFVGNSIKIKASGGIRNYATLETMYNLGADRFGINVDTSIKILEMSKAMKKEKDGVN